MRRSRHTGRTKSVKAQVFDHLVQIITDPHQQLGERLPGIVELAQRFDTSPRTIQTALEDLEERGYVVMKHGSGTFIQSQHRPATIRDTVAVCMETRAHLFGELAAELAAALNQKMLLPLTVNTASPSAMSLLKRLAHADADCLLVHTDDLAFIQALKAASLHHLRPIIAFVRWGGPCDWPNLYRVLTDGGAGGRLVARHLHARGHRRVLLLGPPTTVWERHGPEARHLTQTEFITEWTRLGGAYETLESSIQKDPETFLLEETRVEAALTRPEPPTAVFGLMDLQAWDAQQIIRRRLPQLEGRLEIVGYYDTPFSRVGGPPFTSVSLNLPRMVAAGMEMFEAIRAGREPERKTVWIEPTLIVR